jgi:hypothetical protein
MFRRMLSEAVTAVDRGEDPPGVVRGASAGFIDFDASQRRDGLWMQA